MLTSTAIGIEKKARKQKITIEWTEDEIASLLAVRCRNDEWPECLYDNDA